MQEQVAGAVGEGAEGSVGFRDVRWDTTPDAEGTPFTLVVNDQPVFVKGVNWIPDDALTVRVTRDGIDVVVHHRVEPGKRHRLELTYSGTPKPVRAPTERTDIDKLGWTVTDDGGLASTVAQKLQVTGSVIAADAFQRAVAGGLGVADAGGPWSVSAGGTRQSVTTGAAQFVMAPGTSGLGLHGGATPFDPAQYYLLRDGQIRCGLVAVQWALVDHPPGGGGFCCVPGSHKASFPLPGRPDGGLVVEVPLAAGDLVLFTEALTHGTLDWQGPAVRRTLLYKYSPGSSTWAEDQRWPSSSSRAESASMSCAGASERATTRPPRSTVARPATRWISASLWVTSTTPQPCCATRVHTASSASISSGRSTAVGSSSTSRRGSRIRHFTISTRWRSPTERSCTRAIGSSASP